MKTWATDADGELVLVEAEDQWEAQRLTGMTFEEFHPASAEEIEAWHQRVGGELTDVELSSAASLVRRELRAIFNRRRKDRATGRWQPTDGRGDANLARARRLSALAAKLEDASDA